LKPLAPVTSTVFFASPLENEQIDRIRHAYPDLRLLVPAELWPKLRYTADHGGLPRELTASEEATWRGMMAEADIFFDFDRGHLADMRRLAPKLRWIQSTSAGVVHYVEQSRIDEAGVVVTTASGVHAIPLAEWVAFAVLWHEKRAPHLAQLRQERRWERLCGGEALGKTAVILGYGAVGRVVGRYLEALGVRVYGVTSRGLGKYPADADGVGVPPAGSLLALPTDELLDTLMTMADYLVIALPGVKATDGLISRRRLLLMPQDALVINIGRGSVVDEPAMIELLSDGKLGGAALDVFAVEPLPQESPLWAMPNVIINPHSASTSHRENGRITDIFIDNMGRYLRGEPLVNVFQSHRGY